MGQEGYATTIQPYSPSVRRHDPGFHEGVKDMFPHRTLYNIYAWVRDFVV